MQELLSGIDTMSMPPDRYLDALMKISHRLTLLLLSAGLLGSATATAAATSYFRYPAVRGDTVVFTAEGDLWKSSVQGGLAQRLTTHPGYETNAAISRDGQWLAFSASYEGAQDAYVMPLAGGLPRRISYDNGGVLVLGWTAQGEVLISTQNTDGPASRRIVAAIDPVKLSRRVFPVADANDAVLDDAGKTLFFARFGLAMTNDNVRNYRGGAHAQLWRYELDGKSEAVPCMAMPWYAPATTSGPCGGRAGSITSATRAAATICGACCRTATTAARLPITRSGTCAMPSSATARSCISWAPTCRCWIWRRARTRRHCRSAWSRLRPAARASGALAARYPV